MLIEFVGVGLRIWECAYFKKSEDIKKAPIMFDNRGLR